MNYKLTVKCILTSWILLLSGAPASAQQTAQKFIQETRYLLSLPEGYNTDTSRRWPLMVFLHGSGESGSDIEKVKMHGPPKLIAAGKKFPFIVVSPQADDAGTGWETETLFRLLSSVRQHYRVDNERVYLTGLSMGGFGTWALALKHPQEFAAIIPICGGGDTTDAWKLRHIPIWCFHGALDNVVPVERDQEMVAAAKKYNSSVKFTIYPDAYHNSWERTYNNDSIYDWLLAQKKFVYQQVKADAAELKKYTGSYAGPDKDTISVLLENDTLKGKTPNGVFSLKPAGDRLFFIEEHLPVDIRFILNASGKADSFLLQEDRRIIYRKIADK